ncbi:hypothetical protein AOQ84DRAFT_372229 [Glonium stellatum]|uniref:Uncharacterized protein n=1 Tax=Glonium stellatum TaxID=574774 RepID=A0A8E2FAF1_9PEZI|nr:hypothetical protein AOQ84DRAFT_372229 [Glonium stellatum]
MNLITALALTVSVSPSLAGLGSAMALRDEVARLFLDVLTNGSLVEAHQIVAASNDSQLQWLCTNFDALDAHWKASFGLSHLSSDIKAVICNPSTSVDAITAVSIPLTHMFRSEISAAGQIGTAYLTNMCTLMYPRVIKSFGLDIEEFFNSICPDVGDTDKITFRTDLDSSEYVLGDKAATDIMKYRSQVFARWIILSVTDISHLHYLCNNFGLFELRIGMQGLNSSFVRIDICNTTHMPNPNAAKVYLMEAMSSLFEAMLINAAPPHSRYMSSLCEDLDEASMNSLGFDGHGIRSAACSLSSVIPPRSAGFKRHGGPNPCLSCEFQYNSCRSGGGSQDGCDAHICGNNNVSFTLFLSLSQLSRTEVTGSAVS